LKGASSILFGRGATGGVINQVFKKPTGKTGVNDSNRWGIAPSFKWDISADTDLTLNLLHQEEEGVFDYGVPMCVVVPPTCRSTPFTALPITG
jgi:catecholate siderophore receptor